MSCIRETAVAIYVIYNFFFVDFLHHNRGIPVWSVLHDDGLKTSIRYTHLEKKLGKHTPLQLNPDKKLGKHTTLQLKLSSGLFAG